MTPSPLLLLPLWLACAGDETYVPQPIGGDSGWTAPDGGGDGGGGGELCSDPAGGPQATLRVSNRGTLPVQVYWVDTSCAELPYAQLQGGQSYDQPTYVNHAWRVRVLGSGELLAELLVDETLEIVEVSP
ncbi:hypothetical protein L6R53_01490 [Myxococcota bacterium]|nr:hypothetical protein [Myxococcota bacterium]